MTFRWHTIHHRKTDTPIPSLVLLILGQKCPKCKTTSSACFFVCFLKFIISYGVSFNWSYYVSFRFLVLPSGETPPRESLLLSYHSYSTCTLLVKPISLIVRVSGTSPSPSSFHRVYFTLRLWRWRIHELFTTNHNHQWSTNIIINY